MQPNCSTCGFFIPRDCARDDIRREMEHAEIDGACGESSSCLFFIPYIPKAELAQCGKHMEPVGENA